MTVQSKQHTLGLNKMTLDRLCANPVLSVADLQMALRDYKAAGGQDLDVLVAFLKSQNLTWKTAPMANVMASCSLLAKSLFKVCPNTMIPIKKFEMAMQKEKSGTLAGIISVKDKLLDQDWASTGGQYIRRVAAMYKHCKRSKKKTPCLLDKG